MSPPMTASVVLLRPPFSLNVGLPLSIQGESSLPTIIEGGEGRLLRTVDDLTRFLSNDLDLHRLNQIHDHLWIAGKPINARPFHKLRHGIQQVCPTHQHDLHLLSYENAIFLKALPRWLLDYSFWEENLCIDEELHRSACGLLVSWIWLIQSPLDMGMVREVYGLIPPEISWSDWRNMADSVTTNIDLERSNSINKRYHYGELNLSTINLLYRMRFFTTYLDDPARSNAFFIRHFGWIGIAFLYYTTILTAMQVGFIVEPLQSAQAFSRATFGFVTFSLVTAGLLYAIWILLYFVYAVAFLVKFVGGFLFKRYQERHRRRLESEL